ncbi:hypothetical protein ER308_01830 [Egibacter rhizosphaerae]|uniref:Serpin domain-containing protein n=1 Tax=Egibacter rhizosphaerae TaxID=1670831 RepID=A0A411YB43_9ACTN|nr:hypothetical protein ER308_01830 [Egibacter rhizosphaerae]
MGRTSGATRAAALFSAAALLASACGSGTGAPAEAGPVGDVEDIDRSRLADVDAERTSRLAEGIDAFGFALLDELRDDGAGGEDDDAGTVLSPVSAAALLVLLLPGAEGETAEEIAAALHTDVDAVTDGQVGGLLLDLATAPDVDLTLANAAWFTPDYPVEGDYREEIRATLGASIDELDLGDADDVEEIDAWAEERTDGLVDEISDALGLPRANAVAVLANATHFAGDWTDQFDPDDTAAGPFTRDDGAEVTTDLMHHDEADVFVAADHERDLVPGPSPLRRARGGDRRAIRVRGAATHRRGLHRGRARRAQRRRVAGAVRASVPQGAAGRPADVRPRGRARPHRAPQGPRDRARLGRRPRLHRHVAEQPVARDGGAEGRHRGRRGRHRGGRGHRWCDGGVRAGAHRSRRRPLLRVRGPRHRERRPALPRVRRRPGVAPSGRT